MHSKKVHECVLLYSLPSTLWPEVNAATLHGLAKFSMKASALINAPTLRHHPGHCYHQKPKKVEGNTLNGKLFHPPSPTRLHGTSGQTLSCLFSRVSTRGWMICSSLVQTMRWWELRKFPECSPSVPAFLYDPIQPWQVLDLIWLCTMCWPQLHPPYLWNGTLFPFRPH